MRTYIYLVTSSEVETVPVGSYIVDYERKGDDWGVTRTWSLYYEVTGEFRDGWVGRKLDRLCTRCRKDYGEAALHGHDGLHGDADKYRPPAPEATSEPGP